MENSLKIKHDRNYKGRILEACSMAGLSDMEAKDYIADKYDDAMNMLYEMLSRKINEDLLNFQVVELLNSI